MSLSKINFGKSQKKIVIFLKCKRSEQTAGGLAAEAEGSVITAIFLKIRIAIHSVNH